MIVVRMHHLRTAGFCSGGARAWFRAHDLSWSDFLTNGLPVETLEATGDAFAKRACDIARKEAADGGQE
jgi:hypothetical protein